MRTQLKYLISLLLILGLTVNEGIGYSQINSSNYHQSYKTSSLKKFSYKNTKLFTSKKNILLDSKIFIFFFTHFTLLKGLSKQIQISFKLQLAVHQHINSIKIKQAFLRKKLTSSNSFPFTYIA